MHGLANPRNPVFPPNWEYFVQAAEYVRLFRLAAVERLELTFEDELMDLTLRRGERLLVCCEVKERPAQIETLLNGKPSSRGNGRKGLMQHQRRVDLQEKDRGNDPLRKAKYLATKRPDYFYAVAIGRRYEFRMDYPTGWAFRLTEDVIPWI